MKSYYRVLQYTLLIHILTIAGLIYYWDPIWFIGTVLSIVLIGTISYECYLHRYVAHNSYSISKPLEILCHILCLFNLQGGVIGWASAHVMHHKYSDTDKDPYPGTGGWRTWLSINLFRSSAVHLGTVKRLSRNKLYVFTETHYFKIFWGVVLLLALINPKIVLYCIFINIIYVFHFSGVTNLILHNHGTRPYEVVGNSKNLWFLTFFVGSAYHNNHHAFPSSYTCSSNKKEFDYPAIFIKYLLANKPLVNTCGSKTQ